jgi:hypothetical protein
MKRILISTIASMALAVPAIAVGAPVAGQTTHVGHLVGASSSQVKFKQRITDPGSVTSFVVRNFGVACDGGVAGTLRVAKLLGSIEISDAGTFKARNDNGQTVFKVQGEIKRNKAFGTFRYFGQVVADDGVTRACNSGRLGWVTRP